MYGKSFIFDNEDIEACEEAALLRSDKKKNTEVMLDFLSILAKKARQDGKQITSYAFCYENPCSAIFYLNQHFRSSIRSVLKVKWSYGSSLFGPHKTGLIVDQFYHQ